MDQPQADSVLELSESGYRRLYSLHLVDSNRATLSLGLPYEGESSKTSGVGTTPSVGLRQLHLVSP